MRNTPEYIKDDQGDTGHRIRRMPGIVRNIDHEPFMRADSVEVRISLLGAFPPEVIFLSDVRRNTFQVD